MRRNESDGTGIRCIPHPAADFGIGLGGTGPSTGGSGFGGVCRAAAPRTRYTMCRWKKSCSGNCACAAAAIVSALPDRVLPVRARDRPRASPPLQALPVPAYPSYRKISDERFARMAKTYEDEQRQLESRKVELDAFIATAKEQRLSVDSFLDMVRKYTDITELTAEIIRTFVEKIEVMKPEKVPGTRTKKQTIVIHWNFIGAVEIPDTKEKTA